MGRLSNNFPALTVAGNRIVEVFSGRPVILRGVNRSGLEYTPPEAAGSIENRVLLEADLDQIIGTWGANIIRIPFNQDWALSRPDYDAEPYLAIVDWMIETASAKGAYTLLDLQWLDAVTLRGHNSDGSRNFVPPLPDLNSIALWSQLAARYRDEPAVLYDIFNEPHDRLDDDPIPLLGIDASGNTAPVRGNLVTMELWQPWASALISAIRQENQEALIFVSGINWGFDLRGHPIPGVDGVVYSTHVYPNKGSHWDEAFGDLSLSVPVFAGEWGGTQNDLAWGRELARYLAERQMGWTAWSWADLPMLGSRDELGAYRPSAFGEIVRDALRPSTFSPG